MSAVERQLDPSLEFAPSSWQRDLELLSLSIAYAAKYYCIESLVIQSFDPEAVTREFALDRQRPVIAVIGLGHYRNNCISRLSQIKNIYSQTVRVL
jgi:hypothetical protein